MTEIQSVTIPCPDCGFEQNVQVWRSVNVTLDGDLRDRLFNGEINFFECQSCGARRFMNASAILLKICFPTDCPSFMKGWPFISKEADRPFGPLIIS